MCGDSHAACASVVHSNIFYSVCVVAAMSCACTVTTKPEPERVMGISVVGPTLAGTEFTVPTMVAASATLIGFPSRVLGPELVDMCFSFLTDYGAMFQTIVAK